MSIAADTISANRVSPGDVVYTDGVPIGIALEAAEEGASVRVMIQGITTMNPDRIDVSISDEALDEAYERMAQGARAHSHGTYAFMTTGTGYHNNVYINAGVVIGADWARTSQKERFPDEVVEKAWKLLEDYMSPNQYFAFMEDSTIEIENNDKAFRLLINKKGNFTILEGKKGDGILASSGRIRSYDYPLGDEIATFVDWFQLKTKELISKWNCGTYGIVKEGQRR